MVEGRRIAVVGTSGSGKTTLARRIGTALGLPVIELDAINWQPGWRGLNEHDPELFKARVAEAVAAESWVCDGNYSGVRPLVIARATVFVWLDYSRFTVMSRVIRRSAARALSGRELWPGTGNRESIREWLSPEHPIRWAWSTHSGRRARYGEMAASLPATVAVHHLRRPRDADALVRGLTEEKA
jgi:adenylate kinase family enzyme